MVVHACNFPQSTKVLGPPPGKTEDEVRSLFVYVGEYEDGTPVVISRWRVDRDELRRIQDTGEVWLCVHGRVMPPVALMTESPFSGG